MTLSYWNLIVENIRINYDFLIASQPKTDCRSWNNIDIPLIDHVKKNWRKPRFEIRNIY